MEENGGDQKEKEPKHHDDEQHRSEENQQCNLPPFGVCLWLRIAHGVRVGLTTRMSHRQALTVDWKLRAYGGWLEPMIGISKVI